MEVGLAVMVTVGPELAVTVTVAVAVAFPPTPVAVAVYLVVALGVTDCVPPVAANAYELPSLPLIVTVVALAARTVKVDGLPAGTVAGLAVISTVGAVFEPFKLVPAHPEKSTDNNMPGTIDARTRRTGMPMRAFAKVISYPIREHERRGPLLLRACTNSPWLAIAGQNKSGGYFCYRADECKAVSMVVFFAPKSQLRLTSG
jgi:hypothetical protein